MRRSEPPRLAQWMLERCAPPRRDEALAGDLLEEFRSGRSTRWYWRQVLSAIAFAWFCAFLKRRTAVLFAALWSMLAPAWLLVFAGFEQRFNLNERFIRMDWPWSSVCDLGLLLAANMMFVWVGIAVYLFLRLSSATNLRIYSLGRGFLASLPVLLTLWASLVVLPKLFLESRAFDQFSAGSIGSYAITSLEPVRVARVRPQATWAARYGNKALGNSDSTLGAIADTRKSAILARLPFFFIVLCTLWRLAISAPPRRHWDSPARQ